ncbi:MAG: hypothetical protein ACI88H_001897 [Cocleimonas sp.]
MYKAFQGINEKSSSSSFHLKFKTVANTQSLKGLSEYSLTGISFESSIQVTDCVFIYQRDNVYFLRIHNKATQSYFIWQKFSDISCLCELTRDYHRLLSPKLSLFFDYTERQQSLAF